MTGKQRRLVAALAGYTQDYARRLIEEPAIRAAIDAPDRAPPPAVAPPIGGDMSLDPAEMLRSIISDPSQDNRVRITATRALTMLERDRPPERKAPVLIDDVPDCSCCRGCTKGGVSNGSRN